MIFDIKKIDLLNILSVNHNLDYEFMEDTKLCVDCFQPYTSVRQGLIKKHLCCHYFMGKKFKYDYLEDPTKNDKIGAESTCTAWLIAGKFSNRNVEKKYCCLHRNEEQKIEFAKMIIEYYKNEINQLDNFIRDPKTFCFDNLRPHELIRGGYDHVICCQHYYINLLIKENLLPPQKELCVNNIEVCSSYIARGQQPSKNSYARYCCAHRTENELKILIKQFEDRTQIYQVKIKNLELYLIKEGQKQDLKSEPTHQKNDKNVIPEEPTKQLQLEHSQSQPGAPEQPILCQHVECNQIQPSAPPENPNLYPQIEHNQLQLIELPETKIHQKIEYKCYDYIKPGENIRPSDHKNHMCCYHYFINNDNKQKLEITKDLTYKEKLLCISSLLKGNVPSDDTEKRFCCMHRSENEFKELRDQYIKLKNEKNDKKDKEYLEEVLYYNKIMTSIKTDTFCYDLIKPGTFGRLNEHKTHLCCRHYYFPDKKHEIEKLDKIGQYEGDEIMPCIFNDNDKRHLIKFCTTKYCCCHRTPEQKQDIINHILTYKFGNIKTRDNSIILIMDSYSKILRDEKDFCNDKYTAENADKANKYEHTCCRHYYDLSISYNKLMPPTPRKGVTPLCIHSRKQKEPPKLGDVTKYCCGHQTEKERIQVLMAICDIQNKK